MASITKQIADTVSSVGVHAAYGDPVELDGSTIVPVAVASYGFGAGEGGAEAQGEGSGGGGGGFAWPVGAYVTRDGYTRFEANTIALLLVGIPFVCVAGRAIARVIRAFKK
ncbi:MAG: hypothetical protein GX862_09750 [Leucobacter sp.]|nr:hypothetical protein [Leucobacter sp.]